MVGARTEGSCSGNLQLGDLNPQLGFTVKITLVRRRDQSFGKRIFAGATGGNATENRARVFIQLKPFNERPSVGAGGAGSAGVSRSKSIRRWA